MSSVSCWMAVCRDSSSQFELSIFQVPKGTEESIFITCSLQVPPLQGLGRCCLKFNCSRGVTQMCSE